MPVLYGVFLYMGVAALKGMQVNNMFIRMVVNWFYQNGGKLMSSVLITKFYDVGFL